MQQVQKFEEDKGKERADNKKKERKKKGKGKNILGRGKENERKKEYFGRQKVENKNSKL